MSAENGKVCCNCRHCIREWHGSDCRCRCEISGDYLGYVRVMEGWCKHWSKEKSESRKVSNIGVLFAEGLKKGIQEYE